MPGGNPFGVADLDAPSGKNQGEHMSLQSTRLALDSPMAVLSLYPILAV